MTIYLRMISTSNGKILKSVYISKTILSQAIDESLFRYVNFKRLLEVETGYTTNEPVHMAVTEAIEKAVESLVLEGIKDNIWEADAPKWQVDNLLKAYAEETKTADVTGLYDRVLENRRSKFAIELSGGTTLMDGDYQDPLLRPFGRGALKWMISPSFTASASANVVNLANKNLLDVGYITYDLNMEWIILPKDRLTPYLYVGGGYGMNSKFENTYGKFQYGGGLEYMASDRIGLKLFAEQNINFSDNIDYIVAGTRDDYYYKFGLGLTYYFAKKKK